MKGDYITATDVKDFCYCNRIPYFKKLQELDEKPTVKMLLGQRKHILAERRLRNYNWINLPSGRKIFRKQLYHEPLGLTGIVDCILLFKNEAAPLEFKVSKPSINEPLKQQLCFYAFLIEHNYDLPVRKGFVWFEDTNVIKAVILSQNERANLMRNITETRDILTKGFLLDGTPFKSRCRDCTYKNICER